MNAVSSASEISPDDQKDEALALSALLASRVCHDLINPVGAVGSGLDVLDDPDMDETMRAAAIDLIRSGAARAIALLKYARLAYGSAGGYGAQINLDDAREALRAFYDGVKADLDWRLAGGSADKDRVRTLLILGAAAADSAPRGGAVKIEGDPGAFKIEATGKKVLLQDDLARALAGHNADIMPKYAPALIAGRLARRAGGAVSARLEGETAIFEASFPNE